MTLIKVRDQPLHLEFIPEQSTVTVVETKVQLEGERVKLATWAGPTLLHTTWGQLTVPERKIVILQMINQLRVICDLEEDQCLLLS